MVNCYCSVPLCKNYYRKKGTENLTWHRFPKDEHLRKVWCAKIRRDVGGNFRITKNTYICSAHFVANDYRPFLRPKRRLLKPTAIPSIFKWTDSKKDMASSELYCYCQVDAKETYMICCDICKRYYHAGCLKSGRPTPLLGDTFFKLICEICSPTGDEVCQRLKLQWTQVLMLALYNLQFQGGGKCGYFRWREHVCSFVDRHWSTFFGNKKKTNTWHGTVAGTLSGGCPHFFKSGTADLGETGWWALAVTKVPAPEEFEVQSVAKLNRKQKPTMLPPGEATNQPVEGLRHRKYKNTILAAMELKEKRSTLQETKKRSKGTTLPNVKSEPSGCDFEEASCSNTFDAFHLKQEEEDSSQNPNDMCLEMDFEIDKEELGLDLESKNFSPPTFLPAESPPINELLSTLPSEAMENVEEPLEVETGDASSSSSSRSESRLGSICTEVVEETPSVCRKRKIKHEEIKEEEQQPKCILMSVYEEHELLKKLESLKSVVESHPIARRLRRKLIVRQKQRELNLNIFDLDAFMRQECVQQKTNHPECATGMSHLDRYMMAGYNLLARSQVNFLTRLMGLEEEQLESTTSPYTLRSLKPFIFRDYETVPLKLKLLLEICAYPYRNDPEWKTPPRHPIDYCYVRPHHIPAANALCHEFFWPGIDLSECLQYPDFSCIAVYRKIVIGFAFMVPDVSYNEAYISFIFTHPEWRNAGIATFMLYHLIQTCMGKDVTLHVSATNPACFLYQKFGFKVEELIIDFYNKYLPVTSKDCKHALFLRLSR